MRYVFTGIIALVALGLVCQADEPKDLQAEMAKAIAACKEALAKLPVCGEWTETTKYHPTDFVPKGGTGTATTTGTSVCDGTWIASTHDTVFPNGQKYVARGMFGWNAKKSCYTLHWFSSMGEVELYEGKLDGKVLTMSSTTPDMGFTMNLKWTFHDADHHAFSITMTAGGETKPFLDSEVCRKGAAPATCVYGCSCGKEKTVAIDAPAPS